MRVDGQETQRLFTHPFILAAAPDRPTGWETAGVSALDARYGRRPRWSARKRAVAVVLALLAGVVAIAVVWGSLESRRDPITVSVETYSVPDASTAVAQVTVRHPSDQDAVCEVKALGEGFAVVGVARVQSAAGDEVSRQDVTISTTARANAVTAGECAPA